MKRHRSHALFFLARDALWDTLAFLDVFSLLRLSSANLLIYNKFLRHSGRLVVCDNVDAIFVESKGVTARRRRRKTIGVEPFKHNDTHIPEALSSPPEEVRTVAHIEFRLDEGSHQIPKFVSEFIRWFRGKAHDARLQLYLDKSVKECAREYVQLFSCLPPFRSIKVLCLDDWDWDHSAYAFFDKIHSMPMVRRSRSLFLEIIPSKLPDFDSLNDRIIDWIEAENVCICSLTTTAENKSLLKIMTKECAEEEGIVRAKELMALRKVFGIAFSERRHNGTAMKIVENLFSKIEKRFLEDKCARSFTVDIGIVASEFAVGHLPHRRENAERGDLLLVHTRPPVVGGGDAAAESQHIFVERRPLLLDVPIPAQQMVGITDGLVEEVLSRLHGPLRELHNNTEQLPLWRRIGDDNFVVRINFQQRKKSNKQTSNICSII